MQLITNKMSSMLPAALLVVCVGATTGCKDLVSGTTLPANTQSPDIVRSPEGALGLYYDAVSWASVALAGKSVSSFVGVSGLLTDELITPDSTAFPTSATQALDSRTTVANDVSVSGKTRMSAVKSVYQSLQRVRGNTNEAIGALTKYAPNASPALRGHAYAVQGMADVMLAELFCSGIPLSTLDFETGYTIKGGSSSTEVLNQAVALFDSASKYSTDSIRFALFAKVGRARALMDLGEFDKASAEVADVPTDYQYVATYAGEGMGSISTNIFVADRSSWSYSVGDRDGGNGLPFISSDDPRSRSFMLPPFGPSGGRYDRWFPEKYSSGGFADGSSPIVIASGIEARLIEAEVALKKGSPTWLTILNDLRTDGTFSEAGTDTTWNPGTGGVAGLRPLEDPGSDTARVTMVFNERAYWLFLTGHRQGDLRRLVRQYNRLQQDVYPSGFWGEGVSPFGDNVNVPLPIEEQIDNPLYTGCFNRDA